MFCLLAVASTPVGTDLLLVTFTHSFDLFVLFSSFAGNCFRCSVGGRWTATLLLISQHYQFHMLWETSVCLCTPFVCRLRFRESGAGVLVGKSMLIIVC